MALNDEIFSWFFLNLQEIFFLEKILLKKNTLTENPNSIFTLASMKNFFLTKSNKNFLFTWKGEKRKIWNVFRYFWEVSIVQRSRNYEKFFSIFVAKKKKKKHISISRLRNKLNQKIFLNYCQRRVRNGISILFNSNKRDIEFKYF